MSGKLKIKILFYFFKYGWHTKNHNSHVLHSKLRNPARVKYMNRDYRGFTAFGINYIISAGVSLHKDRALSWVGKAQTLIGSGRSDQQENQTERLGKKFKETLWVYVV